MQNSLVDGIALAAPGSLKGRGTAWALQHRFTRDAHQAFDDGWGTLEQNAQEEHLPPATHIIEEKARTILSGNDSPDIPFDLSINPYRGCEHVMRRTNVFSEGGWLMSQGSSSLKYV